MDCHNTFLREIIGKKYGKDLGDTGGLQDVLEGNLSCFFKKLSFLFQSKANAGDNRVKCPNSIFH